MGAGSVSIAAAMLGTMLLPTTAQAADEAGSGFGSFTLAANAPVMQTRFDDGDRCAGQPGGTGGCEGVVPETVSMLRKGPIGHALSSVVWPGVLAGNIGSVIAVSGGPPEAAALNSPVRAEAYTGSGADTVTKESYPGTKMVATAKDETVSATADIAQAASTEGGSLNNAQSRSKVALTGPAGAVAEAFSHADDIALAGGVVKIGSVTSTAKGTTDGVKASATGSTLVKDVTIAGVPVTIDEKGVTVQGNNAPVNSAASAAVNAAITNADMSIAVSEPSGKPEGGNIVYSAGSLIFAWKTPGGTVTAILGGATVQLAAVQGAAFSFDLGGDGLAPFTSDPPPAAAAGNAPAAGTPGIAGAPVVDAPAAAPAVAGPDGTAVLAGRGVPLPGAPSPAYAVLGLFGAAMFVAGMRQLPDRVLEARSSTCLLGEKP
jgi:hypothetical protein